MKPIAIRAVFVLALASTSHAWAGQPLETETARFLGAGVWQFEGAFEYQTASEGQEYATPLAFEYGISDRMQLLIEPVPYTSIRPSDGSNTNGVGDVEVTLLGMIHDEDSSWPALAWAAEVKIPTAHDDNIGTGKTDFAGYLIATKRFGAVDVSANLSYTIVGQPSGENLKNTYGGSLAAEYRFDSHWDLVAEVLATSASTSSSDGSVTAPEGGGSEVIGTVGFRYRISPKAILSLGVSYDNNNATLIRPGISILF